MGASPRSRRSRRCPETTAYTTTAAATIQKIHQNPCIPHKNQRS